MVILSCRKPLHRQQSADLSEETGPLSGFIATRSRQGAKGNPHSPFLYFAGLGCLQMSNRMFSLSDGDKALRRWLLFFFCDYSSTHFRKSLRLGIETTNTVFLPWARSVKKLIRDRTQTSPHRRAETSTGVLAEPPEQGLASERAGGALIRAERDCPLFG